jgi:TetR/AcrR family transcriptional regulator, repressor of fatR-cypB operon
MTSDNYAFISSPSDPPSKQAIVRAALRLFVRDGFDATNIRAIGKAAGYTNPAIFKYFQSKDALALHLFERCYARYYARLETTIRPDATFHANIQALIALFVEIIDGSPDVFLFIQDHLRTFWPKLPTAARRKSILRLMQSLLEQGLKEHAIRKDMPLPLLNAALSGFLNQFARMHYFGEFNGKTVDWAADIETIVTNMLR